MPPGAPRKFKSPEELQKKIDAYFAECDEKKKPYTISGLALALDTTRRTLLDYQNEPNLAAFSHTITRAKARIETFVEESLFQPKITQGVAFNLKNNFGWIDKQEHEYSGKLEYELVMPEEMEREK